MEKEEFQVGKDIIHFLISSMHKKSQGEAKMQLTLCGVKVFIPSTDLCERSTMWISHAAHIALPSAARSAVPSSDGPWK